jgi:hypothetical protein
MRLPLATFAHAAGKILRIASVSGLATLLIGNNQYASADESGTEQNELFQRVAEQLDQSGKYLLYQDKTELKRELARRFASTSVGIIYGYRSSSEDQTSRRTRINTLIDQVSGQLTDGVAAVGESIKAGDGFYSRKTFLASEISTTPFAPLFPHPPSNLTALSFLPADTDFFLFHQIDPRSLIQSLSGFAKILALSDALPSSQAMEEELNRNTGFSDTLEAIGTEFGIALAVNKEATDSADSSDINVLIPQTKWAVILHPPDHRVVEHLKEQVAKGSSKISDYEGTTIYSNVTPASGEVAACADIDGWLIVAANADVLKNWIATKQSKAPALTADAEFQRLSAGLPTEANGCFFASRRFGQELEKIRNGLPTKDHSGQAATQIGLAISLDFYSRIIGNLFDGYGVSIQTDNGYRWEAHERKPSASGFDQLLTALFSMLAGFAVASR